MDSRRRRGGATFSFGHIFGDPFALGTISLALLGWLVALIGSIFTDMRSDFNRFYWWALAYMLLCILGVIGAVVSGEPEKYQVAMVAYLAVAVAYNTFAVSSVVFSSTPEQEAAAAGYILLSMMALLWIGYYGTSSAATPRGYIDSLALSKEQRISMRGGSRPMSTNPYDGRTFTGHSNPTGQQMYSTSAMNAGGLEQSSNMSGYPAVGGANSSQPRFTQQPMGTSAPRSPVTATTPGIGGGMKDSRDFNSPLNPNGATPGLGEMSNSADLNGPLSAGAGNGAGAQGEYPYRAKAIYSYEANPDDANEISFTKHEILEVSDVSGRWWQARKENGESGIAPSNYLILL